MCFKCLNTKFYFSSCLQRIFYKANANGDPVATLAGGIDLIYNKSVDIIIGPTDAQGVTKVTFFIDSYKSEYYLRVNYHFSFNSNFVSLACEQPSMVELGIFYVLL